MFAKGKRIKASDKNLKYHFHLKNVVIIIIITFFLFYIKQIQSFNLSFVLSEFNTNLINFVSNGRFFCFLIIAIILVLLYILLIFKGCKSYLRQLTHRQALARMILDNNWYESEKRQRSESFFDTNTIVRKEVITDFPKMYYKFKDNHITLLVGVTMGKAQSKFLELQEKIETGLFCEFIEFTAKEPYYKYDFYYGLSKTRLIIDDVCIKNNVIEFMKGFSWNFNSRPHALIVGSTGSGKTYFLLAIIKALVDYEAIVDVCDPKNADLADLERVMPNVCHKKEDIMFSIETFLQSMMKRNEDMKQLPNYKTGCKYYELGLKPHFLILDEYVAFMEMLDKKQVEAMVSAIKQISMLARQAGYFLILACQRPDAKYLPDGIRDQFHFRVALGFSSAQGYRMIFPEADKKFLTMPAGRGYVDMGNNLVHEFYSPFVSKGYDFSKEIEKALFKNGIYQEKEDLFELLYERKSER